MVNKTILKAENIIKRYPIGDREIEILHGINVEIKAGEFTMLIGPSGCGKSTLMYTLFGLEPPTRGKVWYKETDLFSKNEDERATLRSRNLSMIHQQPIWIKALNVRENVAFPLFLKKTPKRVALEQAEYLLEVINLSKLADNHPHELSVGEQQRCAFMRAVISNPEVIFADEPTGSLDTDSSTILMELFKKINDQLAMTVVLVTHNFNLLNYATKILSMVDGQIIQEETKRTNPPQTKTNDLLSVIGSWKKGSV